MKKNEGIIRDRRRVYWEKTNGNVNWILSAKGPEA
jgi:hypothetical protein